MHFKKDTNFDKLVQYISSHSEYLMEDAWKYLFDYMDDGGLITYPDGMYYECAGKTIADLTPSASKEDLVEFLKNMYGVTVPTEIVNACRALIVEEGECLCGGELYYTGITAFGSNKPFIHQCTRCGKRTDKAEINE